MFLSFDQATRAIPESLIYASRVLEVLLGPPLSFFSNVFTHFTLKKRPEQERMCGGEAVLCFEAMFRTSVLLSWSFDGLNSPDPGISQQVDLDHQS